MPAARTTADEGGPVVVLAPNAFKGSLAAGDVADAMAAGVLDALPNATVHRVPLADGGDGSLDALVAAGFSLRPVTTRGPTGEPVASAFALRGRTAVVELASACGMARLPGGRQAPMESSTIGLGDAIRAALDAGPRRDRHLRGRQRLDGRGLGHAGRPRGGRTGCRRPGGRPVRRHAGPDRRTRPQRARPATGGHPPHGRHRRHEPPARARRARPRSSPRRRAPIPSRSHYWRRAFGSGPRSSPRRRAWMRQRRPGAGAAGGTTLAAVAALRADMTSGARYIREAVGLADVMRAADLVITGEGSIDAQSLLGKAVGIVCSDAASLGVPVMVVCGRDRTHGGRAGPARARRDRRTRGRGGDRRGPDARRRRPGAPRHRSAGRRLAGPGPALAVALRPQRLQPQVELAQHRPRDGVREALLVAQPDQLLLLRAHHRARCREHLDRLQLLRPRDAVRLVGHAQAQVHLVAQGVDDIR